MADRISCCLDAHKHYGHDPVVSIVVATDCCNCCCNVAYVAASCCKAFSKL